MIEEIKVNGVLYKISKEECFHCSKCDLKQFCDENLDFDIICSSENNNYIFKKQ